MIHKPLECGWRICETKWHHLVGKTTPWRNESGFLLVLLSDADLEVAQVTVKIGRAHV